jgi:anaerobic selenocysteine-containing dehydrogenase
VAYKKFRENPEANPLKTPSGKIEIYSSKLAEIAATWELEKDETISPLPVYASTFDGWDAPERARFPLQLFGFHFKARTHSSYGNVDVLKAACRQEVWLNPVDAEKRGIKNGDTVRVFNDRGEVRIEAKVTPRIMPGVSAMGQGLARRQYEWRSCRPRLMHQHPDHAPPVTAGQRQPAAHQSGTDREGVTGEWRDRGLFYGLYYRLTQSRGHPPREQGRCNERCLTS